MNRIATWLLTLALFAWSGSSALAQPTFTVGFSPFRNVNSSNSVRSPTFGLLPPLFGSGTAHCGLGPFLGLASGLIVHHDGKYARGLNLRCSNYGVVGATDQSVVFDPGLAGSTSTHSTLLECESGKAISGVRLRSGLYLDAISIACATINPSFADVINVTDINGVVGPASIVNRDTSLALTQPVGGAGGNTGSFDCPADKPFVHGFFVRSTDVINTFQVICTRVVTGVTKNTGLESLTARTIGQKRVLKALDTDAFTVEWFNLGPPGITTNKRYLDIIFSITQVDLVGAIPQGCYFVTSGRLRCFPGLVGTPIATGARLTLPLTLRAMVPRPDAPLVAVQSSFELPDADYSDNTYGFSTRVD